jgi:adenine-specific DNA-methyltransferase
MYPRLYIAKQLLKDDGVIFVSIDDNEVAQLRILMDEVFGEENFVGQLPTVMNLKGNNDEFGFAGTHEYTIVYSRNRNLTVFNQFSVNDDELDDWQEDEIGFYKQGANLKATGTNAPREKRPNLYFPIFIDSNDTIYVTENNCEPTNFIGELKTIYPIANDAEMSWRWSKDKFNNESQSIIISRNGSIGIYKKQRPSLGDLPSKKPKTIFYKPEYSSGNGTAQLQNLFGVKLFSNPKPVNLIKDFLEIGSSPNDLILDFFAGSGTTGDAVMQLNTEDKANDKEGNRKYILVQIPEKIDAKKNKTAYDFVKNELGIAEPTIFEITKERLIRAGRKIGDTSGFKIFETQPIWEDYEFKAKEFDAEQELFDESKLSSDDLQTLLTTWKTYDNIPLTESLENVNLDGYTGYYGSGRLYLMDKGFSIKHLKLLLNKIDENTTFNPVSIIVFGYHFESKVLREIAENISNYANKKKLDIDFVTRY